VNLAAGTKLDHYEVVALIGAGGMGEVYRARDPRLRRDVAVKLLPEQLRSDPERLRRFEKEARTAGALNHPGLLSVFDFGVHDGSPYLVTELLDGTTLGDKLRRGRLPVRKAIDYATQIALALASAHDAGVVHRDIKPGNLFVTTDGRVKILDFGIAKALEQPAEPAAPTMTAHDDTAEGAIVGTAGYMAPEQIRGSAVDHRADIFAFGVVLYEMLSGTAPFGRPRPLDRALATLNDDPSSLSATRPEIPAALELIVRRCIEKDRAQRFQSARDVAFALQALSTESGALPLAPSSSRKRVVVMSVGALVAAGALLLVGRATVRDAARLDHASRDVRFERITYRTGRITRARFAPDGMTIVFSAQFDGDTWKIYSTQPGNRDFRVLVDQEAFLLDVSRTGDIALLLRDQGRLRLARVPLAGGTPRVLLDSVTDAAWAADGSLIAAIQAEDASRIEYPIGKTILENKAAPTTPWRVNMLSVSPGGEQVAHVTYQIEGGPDSLGMVDRRGRRRTVIPAGIFSGVAWRPDGREIWFGLERGVFATTIDGHQRQVVEIPGATYVHGIAPDGRALITLEQRPIRLIGHFRDQAVERDLTWHDGGYPIDLSYDGKLLLILEWFGGLEQPQTYVRSTDGKPAVHLGSGFPLALSPDGAWALVAVPTVPADALTLIPTGAGKNRSLALGPIVAAYEAVFFPDGKRVAIGGHAAGKRDRIWIVDLSGAAPPRPVGPEGVTLLNAVSPDGTKLLGRVIATKQTIMIPVDGASSEPLPELVDSPIGWSADGNSIYLWVVDESNPLMPLPDSHAASFDLHTRRATRLPGFPAKDPRNNDEIWFIAVTPDGASYVYGSMHLSSTLYLVSGLH
jgi:eukaryotic-like serine/threonine-protein kinase